MSFIVFLFNIGLMWYCWRQAEESFVFENNTIGWLFVAASAFNGASALNYLVS